MRWRMTGRMISVRQLPLFLAVISFLSTIAVVPAVADKRVALVVGNSTYKNVAPLGNPGSDARLIADALRSLGFTLVGGSAQLDLDKAQFDNAVQSFSNQIQGADVGLFYYAGHGVQVRGSNYLVPVTANPTRESDVDFQLVDTALVLRQMEGAGTKLNIVILDACRNNPFGGRGLRAAEGGLAQMRAPEGTLISYATQPGSVANDGIDGNSPYTKALAGAIRKPGQDIFQTFNTVGLAVKQATGGSQQPWVSSSPIAGNFYFAGISAVAQPVLAPPVTASSPTDEAARAWSVIQSTTSVAVMEDFIRQFGGTVYGSMARARLAELKKQAVAVAGVPASTQRPLPAPSQPTLARTYEPNVNREGITVSDFNLPSPDARLCQNYCIENSQCTAWVYRAPEGRTDHRPHCWLRNSVSKLPGDSLTISGDVPR